MFNEKIITNVLLKIGSSV